MYEIIFRSRAEKFIKKLDKNIQTQIFKKILILQKNPRIGKPLVGNLTGLWRLRCGKYRIIYEIKEQELFVYILDIGHRKNIY
jgi:mRNA interferase RelE/StbE